MDSVGRAIVAVVVVGGVGRVVASRWFFDVRAKHLFVADGGVCDVACDNLSFVARGAFGWAGVDLAGGCGVDRVRLWACVVVVEPECGAVAA